MNDAVRGLARQFPACGALYGLRAPIGADVGKELRLVGQQVHEEHRNAVQRVVLGGEGVGFADAVPVERRVEDGFREVAVGTKVGPLSLALEPASDGVVSGGLLFEAHFGEFRIADHQVAEDHRHLDHILPDLVFLFARIAEVFRVEVLAFVRLAVFFDPGHGPSELLLIIDAQFDAACNLRAVHGFVAHAQIFLEEIGIGHRTGNAHGHGTDRKIGFAAHLHDGDGRAAEAQQLLFYVGGDAVVVLLLHFGAVDTECGQPLLVMPGQRRGEIDGSRTLGFVEAPDGFGHQRVHIDGFGAVAPAGRYREDGPNVVVAEFVGRGGRFGHAADRRVGDDTFDRSAVGIAQLRGVEFRDAQGHAHRHLFEGFADTAAAAVDDRTDTDFRMVCHRSDDFWVLIRKLSDEGASRNLRPRSSCT